MMIEHARLCAIMAMHAGEIVSPELCAQMIREANEAHEVMALSLRAKVERLERQIQEMEPAECPVRDIFAPGIYAREMTIPKGVTLTGAVHKTKHLAIISKGRIAVNTDEGVKELVAPCIFVSEPGAKRAGYAIEETVWTTIHATTETDMGRLMELLVEEGIEELIGGSDNKQALNYASKMALEN